MKFVLCSDIKGCKSHLKPGRQIHCQCKQLTSVTFSLFMQAVNLACLYFLLNASVKQCRANNIWLHLTLGRSTLCTQDFFFCPPVWILPQSRLWCTFKTAAKHISCQGAICRHSTRHFRASLVIHTVFFGSLSKYNTIALSSLTVTSIFIHLSFLWIFFFFLPQQRALTSNIQILNPKYSLFLVVLILKQA